MTGTVDRKPPVRESKKARAVWLKTRRAEAQYARKLRQIARAVGDLVKGMVAGEELTGFISQRVQTALEQYALLITPWAKATGKRMLADVARRDELAWSAFAQTMSRELRKEIQSAPIGPIMRDSLARQVDLITSLPREAAERFQKLALEHVIDSGKGRAKVIATQIMNTGGVTQSRANLIARTEVARATTELTMARAVHVDSEGYIWRTAHDDDVRPSHKKMEGRFVKWNEPPTLDNLVGHAGALPNCRCYPEPVIPED